MVRKPCGVKLVELAFSPSRHIGGTDEKYNDDA